MMFPQEFQIFLPHNKGCQTHYYYQHLPRPGPRDTGIFRWFCCRHAEFFSVLCTRVSPQTQQPHFCSRNTRGGTGWSPHKTKLQLWAWTTYQMSSNKLYQMYMTPTRYHRSVKSRRAVVPQLKKQKGGTSESHENCPDTESSTENNVARVQPASGTKKCLWPAHVKTKQCCRISTTKKIAGCCLTYFLTR